jgi:hypothetical protein
VMFLYAHYTLNALVCQQDLKIYEKSSTNVQIKVVVLHMH